MAEDHARERVADPAPAGRSAKSEQPDKRPTDRRPSNIVTLAVAIIGVLTGVAGLTLSLVTRQEERAVSLSGHATITSVDTDDGFYVVRLSVANGGLRGLVIRDA